MRRPCHRPFRRKLKRVLLRVDPLHPHHQLRALRLMLHAPALERLPRELHRPMPVVLRDRKVRLRLPHQILVHRPEVLHLHDVLELLRPPIDRPRMLRLRQARRTSRLALQHPPLELPARLAATTHRTNPQEFTHSTRPTDEATPPPQTDASPSNACSHPSPSTPCTRTANAPPQTKRRTPSSLASTSTPPQNRSPTSAPRKPSSPTPAPPSSAPTRSPHPHHQPTSKSSHTQS